MNREYYWEYLQECDHLVEKFIFTAKRIRSDIFMLGNINLEKSVANFIWEFIFFSTDRIKYSESRAKHLNYSAFIQNIWEQKIKPLLPISNECKSIVINRSYEHLISILEPFRNSIVFYCKNNRQLNYYRPILEGVNGHVVILTRDTLYESGFKKSNIQIIEFDLIYEEIFIKSDYFKKSLPIILYLANTLLAVLHHLSPRCVILLEGCHFETEIVSSICKMEKVPTICFQQGWPSLMHTRFKNMSYDYFLTWGKAFNNLWSNYNQTPFFKEVGYPYSVNTNSFKTGIAFFFQAPLFIIDEHTLDEMIRFMIYCAEKYKKRKIYLREHPEYKFDTNKISKIKQYNNIEIATNWKISEVFEQSEIGVSIFSSTLMEGIVHDTIPFVLNITSNPQYYPNVEKEGIGMESKSLNEAKFKIDKLLAKDNAIQELKNNIALRKPYYFKFFNTESITNITEFLNTWS